MRDLIDNEWVQLIGGWILVVGALLVIGYTTANFEWIASIGLLVTALFTLWKIGGEIVGNRYFVIVFVVIFAFLGIGFDGAGNPVYNKPFEYFCPANTVLQRDPVTEEDHDGNMQTRQYFSCYSNAERKTVRDIPLYISAGIRFAEYLAIGVAFLGIYGIAWKSATRESINKVVKK